MAETNTIIKAIILQLKISKLKKINKWGDQETTDHLQKLERYILNCNVLENCRLTIAWNHVTLCLLLQWFLLMTLILTQQIHIGCHFNAYKPWPPERRKTGEPHWLEQNQQFTTFSSWWSWPMTMSAWGTLFLFE